MTSLLLPLLLTLTPHSEPPVLALKTNVPAWGITVMNIEPEYFFSNRFSATLPLYWCPWFITEKTALRVFASQPEVRMRVKPGLFGHYFGLHASVAWFNLCLGDFRYQDLSHPLLGGGISYGFSLKFASHWLADFSIGAGVTTLSYDRFYNIYNGAKVDTRRTLYWGIDKISISIGYLFDL